jgi:Pyruvate/2-oxoacid:ferredoxin oxidoreductase delta subunit/flavodoxin
MKILLFLHSTTGNTRLIVRYAADRLRRAGHECELRDITRHPKPPSGAELSEHDLLGFACPTMYWRPTVTMERFAARLPDAGEAGSAPRPVFQLATAGGEAGAHFALLAEQLAHKGWVTLGAHMVPMVNNWPPHRALSARIPFAQTLAGALDRSRPVLRPELSLLWPDVGEPKEHHRDRLADFLDRMVDRAERRALSEAPAPTDLWRSNRVMHAIGRLMTVEQMRQGTRIQIDPCRCTRCGTCVRLCPAQCLTRKSELDVPRLGDNCTGCWTCYNHCPDRAISGWASPQGAGRYEGPAPASRALFRPGR